MNTSYLHVESDAEFIARLRTLLSDRDYERVLLLTGKDLDDHVWNNHRIQRKFVEVAAKGRTR